MTTNKKEKETVYRIEKVDLRDQQCQEVDKICWEVKNVYNEAVFAIRQFLIFENVSPDDLFSDDWEERQKNLTKYGVGESGKWLRYGELDKMFKQHIDSKHPYRKLHSQVAQQTLKMVDQNFQSTFQSFKAYKKNPDRFNGKPNLPKYKHKLKGRCIAKFPKQ